MQDKSDLLRSLKIDRAPPPAEQQASGPNWLWVGGAAAGAAVLSGTLVWLTKPAPAPAPAPTETAAPAAAGPARGSGLVASGYVVARRRATVAAEVTGRIVEVRVEEGQTVKKGEVLAVLDASLAQADFASQTARARAAQADIARVQADLAEAQRVLVRTQDLAKTKFASEASLTAAEARVESLRAALAQTEAAQTSSERDADRARRQLDRFEIRAPFSGVVVDKAAQAGEIISPASAGGGFTRTGVATIVDMSSLEIEVDVNEAFISRVRPDQPVEAVLDAYPDAVFPAKVIATIPTASRDKATVRVRVGFNQLDPRILPEMAIKVTFLETDQAE